MGSSELDREGQPSVRLTIGETFELVVDGADVTVRSDVARRLLAVLAAHRDETLPYDVLVDAVWDADERPANAVRTLQGQVSRLRRLLGPAAAGLATGRGGYRLDGDVIAVEVQQPGGDQRPGGSSPLIGRDIDIEAVAELLAPGTIVTLVGPGGIGKTALGLAAIERHRDTTGTHVATVPLTPAIAPGDVPMAVARVLGIECPDGQDWVERLVEALKDRPMALLVDNADHVADAAGDLVEALAGQAGVAVVATCRVPLALEAEVAYAVPPLDAEHAAPELFVRQVRKCQPDWEPTDAEMETVGEICVAVGLRPLGIELAAAELGPRSLHEIATSLQRIREPVDGVRPVGAPDDGLRVVIDSASELLDGRRRSCLDQFAAFVGGATAETAAGVCLPAGTRTATVARRLDELVERALLRVEPGAKSTRYSMLDTVRHHALEHLVEGRELRDVRLRHAGAMLRLVEQAAGSMYGPDEGAWVERLDAERADIGLAHHTFLRLGERALALRVATAAYTCCWPRGWTDMCGLVDESLEDDAGVPTSVLAAAFAAGADRASMAGDLQLARRRAERSLGLAGRQQASLAHGVLGDLALHAGDIEGAVSCWRRAAAGFESTVGGLAPYAAASAALALVYGGHAGEASTVSDLAVVAADASACPTSMAFARYVAAEACGSEEPERAATLLAEAQALASSVRSGLVGNLARDRLAALEAMAGDAGPALGRYPTILREWLRLGLWPQLWASLRAMVPLLVAAGAEQQAATVLGGLRGHDQAASLSADALDDADPELVERGAELDRAELVLFAELAAVGPSADG